jgi:hypothetical protein
MKAIIGIIFTVLFFNTVTAQNEIDALRYSMVNYGGTARFNSMSGAYGAVGADFSALSQNPGGMGLYRKSEFTVTPLFSTGKTESKYLGNLNSDFRNTMYLGNIGYVMAINSGNSETSILKQAQFGIGINRANLFNNRNIISGRNGTTSLLTVYLDDANQVGNYDDLSSFGAKLAADAQLMFQDSTGAWLIDLPNGGNYQTKTIETWGSTSETVMSLSGNFAEKLFLGVTFGFPHINYHEETIYTEKDEQDQSPFLKSFQRTDYLNTKASGFNLKIGLIYKPFDFLRLGAALHTPTAYSEVKETYGASMTSYFDQPVLNDDNSTTFKAESEEGNGLYKLTTPMKAIGSIAVVIAKSGLISADYEYIDYTSARLRGDDYSFITENGYIKDLYKSTGNIRIGTEWKAGIFALRGGYSLYGSPYKDSGIDASRQGYSLGAGVRQNNYFIDFAFNHSKYADDYYTYSYAPATRNEYTFNNYSLTVGFRF